MFSICIEVYHLAKASRISSYSFRPTIHQRTLSATERFLKLVQPATIQLLNHSWNDELVELLGKHLTIPAYKFMDESKVQLKVDGQQVYFPSRTRRGIAQTVGQSMRSQSKRKACFEAVRTVLLSIDLQTPDNPLSYQVFNSLKVCYGLLFKRSFIKQIIRQIKHWVFKHHVDTWSMSYCMLVKPQTEDISFPYGPDDNRILKYSRSSRNIHVDLKLPRVSIPKSRSDWIWYQERLPISPKIRGRIGHIQKNKLKRPLLRMVTTKGGFQFPVFQFAWEYKKLQLDYTLYSKKRVLAVDLGLVNFATFVVCEAGKQITAPKFYKVQANRLNRIERQYLLIDILQQRQSQVLKAGIDITSDTKSVQRQQEISRIHAKLQRCRLQDTYAVVNWLLSNAQQLGCPTIAIEELSNYEPPKGMSKLSRRLSNWIRGLFKKLLEHKARRWSLSVCSVNAAWTSSYCPRCTKKGQKIRESAFKIVEAKGRYFYCPHCKFCADRDYIGALNVYRRYRELQRQSNDKKLKYNLAYARPVFYKKTALPRNRCRGWKPARSEKARTLALNV